MLTHVLPVLSRARWLARQVFVDFPYQISAHNVREFFQEFSAQGVHATSISWTEIRTVLREHRMGMVFNEGQLLVGLALNPRSRLLAVWRSIIRLCAVYYVVSVREAHVVFS